MASTSVDVFSTDSIWEAVVSSDAGCWSQIGHRVCGYKGQALCTSSVYLMLDKKLRVQRSLVT